MRSALLFALSLTLAVLGGAGCKKHVVPSGPKLHLELVALDDFASPFDGAVAAPSLDLMNETVGMVSSRHRVSYARLRILPGDEPKTVERRLRGSVASIPLPAGDRFAFGRSNEGDAPAVRTYLVRGSPVLTEADVASAKVTVDADTNHAVVLVTLTARGSAAFESFTATNIGHRLAIIIDDVVQTAPVIQSKIGGGVLQVSLGQLDPTAERVEADRLAAGFGGDP
ncbi:hypothetical protein BH09MYX1_BH09MYX1_18220 [soil metagenome]